MNEDDARKVRVLVILPKTLTHVRHSEGVLRGSDRMGRILVLRADMLRNELAEVCPHALAAP